MTPDERAVFEKASEPVYAEFRKSFGATASKMLDDAQAALKKVRSGK
jgi:hypothetical protein